MPSAFESLSVIVLEAWAMGRPVLVNATCEVLEGQPALFVGECYLIAAITRLTNSASLPACQRHTTTRS